MPTGYIYTGTDRILLVQTYIQEVVIWPTYLTFLFEQSLHSKP